MVGRRDSPLRSRVLSIAFACAGIAGWFAAAFGHVNPWPESAAKRPSIKHIGAIDLHDCGAAGGYCGRFERPLDPAGVIPGRLSIYFEFYPHSGSARSQGTLVATEGGPGYAATESRDDYLALFGPLMSDHDVLIMDNRGTGKSGAVDCHDLQIGEKWTVESVAACGESLGERASLYSTAYAADDLAAVLEAMNVRKIDLYGDSYGTYFEQAFALRHPEALRSIVLDGAYPLSGADYAWYPTYAPAMRDKFNLACARSQACAALPGTSIDHIMPALEQLREHPFTATGHDVDGKERRFQADASQLAIVMYGSAPAFTTVREVDAAARAFTQGDRLPLLRLMAETLSAVDSRDPTADAAKWSAGLAAAVMCQDPPQIFDMRLPPVERALDRDRVVAERKRSSPDTYAPFTIDEYRAMPLDYSFIDQCVGWPVSPPWQPAAKLGANAAYPDVPALVISGELDNLTTVADGAAVAAAFKHGVQIRISNSFHVNALPRARSSCGAEIVRRFFTTMTIDDASCASQIPPVRLVPRFASQSSELEAATGLPGNVASAAQLRLAAAAVLTAGDVLARVDSNSTGHGAGLRGGTLRVTRSVAGIHLELDGVRWVDDVAVSGSVDRPRGRNGIVRAHLQVSPANGSSTLPEADGLVGLVGRLTIQWPEGADHANAHIRGTLGHTKVLAQSPAP
jgi:pimeloyl-ACP methyl ester carboxylesterase